MAWKFFTAQGQEKQVTNPGEGYGSSFPASPADGQIYNYVVDATNAIVWRFRYNSGSASIYKWEFLGGPPLASMVDTGEGTSSTTYVALGTAGPSVTIPRAGDYIITIGYTGYNTSVSQVAIMSYDIGASAASDADSVQAGGSTTQWASGFRTQRKTITAAATALVSKYRSSSGATNFQWRVMSVVPARVS